METTLKPLNVFYQPPVNGRTCSDCGDKITSVNKTGKCRRCAAQDIGNKYGGWNKGLKMKGRD